MAWPVTAALEIALGAAPFEVAPTWTDFSDYLEHIEDITRGRASPLEHHQAGVAAFVLDNHSGDLDPDNTSSPFYSGGATQLLPNRQIRVHVPDTTTYADSFTRGDSATDPGSLTSGEGWWAYQGTWGISTNELYLPSNADPSFLLLDVGEADGYVQFDLGAAGQEDQGAVFRFADPDNYWYIARGSSANTWDVVKVVDGTPTTVESALAGSSADGTTVKIEFDADSVGPVSINGSPVAGTTNTDEHAILATLVGLYAGTAVTNTARWDEFEAGVNQRTLFRGFIEPVDGWQLDHANSQVIVTAADLLAVIAGHEIAPTATAAGSGELAGARVHRILDLVGVPDGWRAIDPGLTIFSGTTFGANALSNLQVAEISEGGTLFVAANGRVVFYERHAPLRRPRVQMATFTLSDDGNDQDFETLLTARAFSGDLIHTARMTPENGELQEVIDSTAQTDYRGQTHDRTGLMMRDDPEAYARAEWIVQQFKDPLSHPRTVYVNGAISTDDEKVAKRVELGDRLTVEITPPNVSQVVQDVIVEGISTVFTSDGWTVAYTLSSGERFGFTDFDDYFELDHSTRGKLGTGRLAF